MNTVPCTTFRCGQPVPADSQPWHRCLTCGQPIKIARRLPRATAVR
jgi:hypothetical protein